MNQELGKRIAVFTDLDAWKEGHQLVILIYGLTKKFPREEQFGLTSQLRRASVSITSNIAEGFGRNSYREKLQFYSMALGSLTEVQNQLFIAKDVGYLPQEHFHTGFMQTIKVHKITNGLIRHSKSIIHNS